MTEPPCFSRARHHRRHRNRRTTTLFSATKRHEPGLFLRKIDDDRWLSAIGPPVKAMPPGSLIPFDNHVSGQAFRTMLRRKRAHHSPRSGHNEAVKQALLAGLGISARSRHALSLNQPGPFAVLDSEFEPRSRHSGKSGHWNRVFDALIAYTTGYARALCLCLEPAIQLWCRLSWLCHNLVAPAAFGFI